MVNKPELVSISDGDNICVLCPSVGGSIVGWSVGGQQMLRQADTRAISASDPLQMASFPLVPYSNRIGDARFNWKGRQIDLVPNFAPESHAIHGIGWKQAWTISAHGDSHILLQLDHHGDAHWPWPFSATQSLRVENNTLKMELSAANLAGEIAPLAFGHHPYFDQSNANLSFGADRVFLSGDDALPTEAIVPEGPFDFSNASAIAGRNIDHCYAGWDRKARITWHDRPLALDIASDMPAAVVYIPQGGSAFCFEPVPHINNALNRPGDLPAMPAIAPGTSFTAMIRLTAVSRKPTPP